MFDTLFENQVGFMYLLLAAIFFITRVIVRAYPPKGINPIYGYRTKRSMKDQESWDFAQEHANQMMLYTAFVFLGISALFYQMNIKFESDLFIMMSVFILILGVMVYMTERALKSRTNKQTE